NLSAELGPLLKQHDAAAAKRRHARRLEAGHAAADDHDTLGRGRRTQLAELALASGSRVLHARHGPALVDAIDPALAGPPTAPPWSAPTQRRISSSPPARALRGSSGSATSAGVMPTTSIWPAATRRSACTGSTMRLA